MESASRPPSPPLRGLVRPYVGYRQRDGRPGVHHGLPDTSLTFVLTFDEPLAVGWLGEPATMARHWALVAGLHDRPALISHHGSQHGIQVALTPAGCRAFLGMPAAALRGEMVTLDDLLGGSAAALYDAVAGRSSWAERFQALDIGLAQLLRRDGGLTPEPELVEGWRRLHADPATRVDALAADLGWSRRRLHARFVAELGVGPKQVARLVRFRRARDRLVRGERIAEVATAVGYSDQPHLTREWRAFAGRTPAEWLREERPFVQDRPAGVVAPWPDDDLPEHHPENRPHRSADAVALAGLP